MSNHHIKTVLAALVCKICDAFRGSVSRDVVFRISCGFCPSPEKGIFAVHGFNDATNGYGFGELDTRMA